MQSGDRSVCCIHTQHTTKATLATRNTGVDGPRHMETPSSTSLWDRSCPTRVRRPRPRPPTTLTTRPKRTVIPPSTTASPPTRRGESRSMGQKDLSRVPLDGEVIMQIGGGKAHGHHYIGDIMVDTASTPSLAELRAKETGSTTHIVSQPSATLAHMERLLIQLDEQQATMATVEQRLALQQQQMAQQMAMYNQQMVSHNQQVA